MTIETQTRVGQIAAEYPLATRVFARHHIDFCCGGGRPLAEACEKKGLDVDALIAEIRREVDGNPAPDVRWDQAPLRDVIEHILFAYHRPLREELPRLDAMARKVLSVHGDKRPETLGELVNVFAGLRAELDAHMMKEEQILFPAIQAGHGATADGPIAVMMHEHDDAAAALHRLRELTDDYTVPDEACNTWRALWHGLEALETSLHEHIHLENNILFPRALEQ